jgi:hypothetical protein
MWYRLINKRELEDFLVVENEIQITNRVKKIALAWKAQS